jgi:hypothetical protein
MTVNIVIPINKGVGYICIISKNSKCKSITDLQSLKMKHGYILSNNNNVDLVISENFQSCFN